MVLINCFRILPDDVTVIMLVEWSVQHKRYSNLRMNLVSLDSSDPGNTALSSLLPEVGSCNR